jgi:hypothetical protein
LSLNEKGLCVSKGWIGKGDARTHSTIVLLYPLKSTNLCLLLQGTARLGGTCS